MMQAFVITLREGLEAFLIVAISLAYLRKSGRHELVPAVHWGIALSILISIAAAMLFRRAANQALWEGLLAVAAAASVATLTVHMWRTARRIKGDIEGQLRPNVRNLLEQGLGVIPRLHVERQRLQVRAGWIVVAFDFVLVAERAEHLLVQRLA